MYPASSFARLGTEMIMGAPAGTRSSAGVWARVAVAKPNTRAPATHLSDHAITLMDSLSGSPGSAGMPPRRTLSVRGTEYMGGPF